MDIYVSYTCLKITSVFHITLTNEIVNIHYELVDISLNILLVNIH